MTNAVPKRITPAIRNLCTTLGASGTPVMVHCQPLADAKPHDCFLNVRDQCARTGGALITGWLIWTWPDVLLEAIHHAVWRTPEGELVDITPHAGRFKRVMFAPDSAASFDFAQAARRPNRFAAVSEAGDVIDFVAAGNRYFHFLAAKSAADVASLRGCPTSCHETLVSDHLNKLHRVWEKHLKPRDRCFCGSGRKFFRCCKVLPPSRAFVESRQSRRNWIPARDEAPT